MNIGQNYEYSINGQNRENLHELTIIRNIGIGYVQRMTHRAIRIFKEEMNVNILRKWLKKTLFKRIMVMVQLSQKEQSYGRLGTVPIICQFSGA